MEILVELHVYTISKLFFWYYGVILEGGIKEVESVLLLMLTDVVSLILIFRRF